MQSGQSNAEQCRWDHSTRRLKAVRALIFLLYFSFFSFSILSLFSSFYFSLFTLGAKGKGKGKGRRCQEVSPFSFLSTFEETRRSAENPPADQITRRSEPCRNQTLCPSKESQRIQVTAVRKTELRLDQPSTAQLRRSSVSPAALLVWALLVLSGGGSLQAEQISLFTSSSQLKLKSKKIKRSKIDKCRRFEFSDREDQSEPLESGSGESLPFSSLTLSAPPTVSTNIHFGCPHLQQYSMLFGKPRSDLF